MKWSKIILLYVLFFLFYGALEAQTRIIDTEKKVYALGVVESKKLLLSREECKSTFSFCSDGFEQPFRNIPLLVQLNERDFIKSYDSAVFVLYDRNSYDSLNKIYNLGRTWWDLNKSFDEKTDSNNQIDFKAPNFYTKKVNKYLEHLHLNKKFNGVFSYSSYIIEFKCMYLGKRNYIVPNLNKRRRGVVTEKLCDVYLITQVDKLESISKKE